MKIPKIRDTFNGLTDEIESRMITSEQRVFFDSNTDFHQIMISLILIYQQS